MDIISLMIPTRGAPKQFNACVNSFVSTCTQKDQIEFIIKVDSDTNDKFAVEEILKKYECKYTIINSDRRRGYLDLDKFFMEEMIPVSQGKMLWMLSDDQNLMYGDWAGRILSMIERNIHAGYVRFSSSRKNYKQGKFRLFGNACPIISRKLFDALGCLSMNGVQIDVFLRKLFFTIKSKVESYEDILVAQMVDETSRKHGGLANYEKTGHMKTSEYIEVAEKIDRILMETI